MAETFLAGRCVPKAKDLSTITESPMLINEQFGGGIGSHTFSIFDVLVVVHDNGRRLLALWSKELCN